MKTDRLEIRIEPELKQAAQDKAKKEGIKLSQLITNAIKNYIK